MRPAITMLLVASRGVTARRVIRTAREMGIGTVAVFAEADRDARFVAEADGAVALDRFSDRGPGAYLDAAALVEAGRRAGVDAVHPGFGALAGDAGFAWRCAEAGLLYCGPSPETVALLGSKLETKALAAGAGVPVLEAEEVEGYPPGKLESAAEMLGWPVAVKASAAGGRSLQVVREGEDLVAAVEAVRRRATATSGDGTVFLEPWLEPVRRIEVQLFGDAGGRLALLFDREASLARDHRAVIAEAPTPKLPPPMRERLAEATTAVAEAAGYIGAGTAAFLLRGEELWFLGISTRLDPWSVLTESILGLDLVRMQLAVAEGQPIPVEARHCSPSGYAVGARILAAETAETAETAGNAGADRSPAATGTRRVRRFAAAPVAGVQVEADVAAGSPVDPQGDGSRLATVVAHATNRPEALLRLRRSLEGLRIHGVTTNRDELIAALGHPEVRGGEVDSTFFERQRAALDHPFARRGGPDALVAHALAAALVIGRRGMSGSAVLAVAGGKRVEVRHHVDRDGLVTAAEVDGTAVPGLRVGGVTDEAVDLEIDGLRRPVAVAVDGDVVDCDSRLGHTGFVVVRVCSGVEGPLPG